MRNIGRGKRRLLAGVLGVTLAVAFGGQCALAQGTDEEDLPLDTKLFRRFMKDLGLQRDGDNQINYRERAPLVVPPSRALPPPQTGTVSANNPAWPKDPEVVQQRREAAAKGRRPRTAGEAEIEASRPLRPNELDRDRIAVSAPTADPKSPRESARPLRPSELGSKGLFGGLFSNFGSSSETAPFIEEPPRENLTAPPPGYQTPSPSQPYGLTHDKKARSAKPATLESRAVGNGQ
jgi:hypothetical protein